MSVAAIFDRAQQIADTVLYEGYLLYPYRASSSKNRVRFQFGVVAPRAYAVRDGSERWALSTECIAEYDSGALLDVRLRFLHTPARAENAAWDEGVEGTVDVGSLQIDDRLDHETPFDIDGVEGRVVVRACPMPGPYPLTRVHVSVENLTDWDDDGAGREAMLRHSLLSTQVLLAVSNCEFISSIDPPAFARAAVEGCATNGGLWPVLAGPGDDRAVMLCSPIILYDHPEIAAESDTEFCDATEIDEMLAIRVLTLTDDEKREARATDPRAREIIDRWGDFPAEMIERLHGAVRSLKAAQSPETLSDGALPWWDPESELEVDPSSDVALVVGGEVCKGDKVSVHPLGRSDAQDVFLVGRLATVTGVFRDVDGDTHVAVTIDDDPAADLHDWYGRYLYFKPDELQAVR